ncbi:efflux RND transporter periplasmic adaptor subunit [Pacificoceanicola onchidii]|uniref:efflux RND transporter periplasmic adaptor subunit n=1 Tax=Pacificoceanicola onchidii TaxID=2562685 RepID=UPI001F0CFF12|nr:efflux RND transporter periplasmic adaptor subunit [Pacificoceanicola onchidii]
MLPKTPQGAALSRALHRTNASTWRSAFARASTHVFAVVALAVSVLAAPVAAQESVVAKIGQVESRASGQDREFYGRVVALETVDLAFQVGGQIIELPIVEGASIPKGTLIAGLDPVPFELALAQATAQFDQASRTLARMEKLQGSSVSQASVDDARTSFDLAKVQVDQAQRSLDQARLSAPFDALVSSRLVANQSTVAAGTPVVRLHNMSEIRIEISVPEVLFQRAGRDPDVTLSAKFPASEQRFPLEVREFNAETAAVGQTYTITLGMNAPEDFIILPGSSVVVETRLNSPDQQISIPRSALVFAPDGAPQIMRFQPQTETTGTVKATNVEIVPNETGEVIVLSGLEAGQEYIAAGASKLLDGQTVTRFKGFGE